MWDNIIGRHIRRTNRNLLLTNLALLAVLATVTLLNGRYLVNFLLGPFPADDAILGERHNLNVDNAAEFLADADQRLHRFKARLAVDVRKSSNVQIAV